MWFHCCELFIYYAFAYDRRSKEYVCTSTYVAAVFCEQGDICSKRLQCCFEIKVIVCEACEIALGKSPGLSTLLVSSNCKLKIVDFAPGCSIGDVIDVV